MALDVRDLHAPPLTERADLKINNFVPPDNLVNDLEIRSEKQLPIETEIEVENIQQEYLMDVESKLSWKEESKPVPLQFSQIQ